nr:hypothetical protein [Tanacetum cinerariifolium]
MRLMTLVTLIVMSKTYLVSSYVSGPRSDQGAPVSTDTELGGYMREFEIRVRRYMDEIYSRLDDEQSGRQLLAGQLNMLFRDRRAHVYIRHLMETKARLSREAWVQSMDASDLARGEAPPLPDYVPGPEHVDDEIVVEDQPYVKDASPTAQSPEYEEHPAPADSVVIALPASDQAPSAEETEPFKTDESATTPPPHPAYHMTARISIPALLPVPAWSDSEVARLLAMSSPPSSPLSPLSLPPPQIPFPPLPPILSPPLPVLSPTPPPSPIHSLGYRAAMIRLRAEAASTSHSPPLPPPFILSPTRSDAPSSGIPPPLPISAPTSLPPLQLPFASRREDRPEVTLPPQKRAHLLLLLLDHLEGQVTILHEHVIALQAQVTALQGQQGPAGGLTQPELPEEASSSS